MGAVEELREYVGEISDLGRARAVLAWDERTQMPAGGAGVRAEQLATLTRIRHEMLQADRLGRLLDAAAAATAGDDPDSFGAALVRVTRRDWEKARLVPAELRAETARATSIAERAWELAREASDFASLRPHLERVVELRRRYVECFEVEHPYDALLDDFEPGMRTADLEAPLAELRDGTVELLGEIASSGIEVDASCLFGEFDLASQRRLAAEVAGMLPLEPGSWRLDETVHPFATGIGISDLRITTRFEPTYVGTALWAVIHEVGHALYQNGIAPELERTPLCRSVSLGFDESQSRLWENWVGRGGPFVAALHPVLARHFPEQFGGVEPATLHRAANRVEASPIRVEADEVSYNLHIVIRFELEIELFTGELTVAELPEAWREKTRSYLGLETESDADGVLQDVHWPSGSFGYFPTYSIGNMIAAQIWELARAELPDLDAGLERGETAELGRHLRELLYRHGAKHQPAEMVRRLTGGPLTPGPLLAHLREKYGSVYELTEA